MCKVIMYTKNNLVAGWGINDVDYPVTISKVINGKRKQTWICPYYKDWKEILKRCFCKSFKERSPTYQRCTVTDEWMYLSNFIKWVDNQPNKNWVNCHLDKDLLFAGNKHYSSETVVYIPRLINVFILDSKERRGELMIGASPSGRDNKPYQSSCSNPFTKKRESLGRFCTEIEAHLAWKAKKREHAVRLTELIQDERVIKRLKDIYL